MAESIQENKIFLKYINGECSQQELHFIATNYSAEERKKIIDDIINHEWKEAPQLQKPLLYKKILEQIHLKIDAKPRKAKVIDYHFYGKVAAVFLIFATTVLFFVFNFNQFIGQNNDKTVIISKTTDFGQKLKVRLPDNSIVVLNYGTTLSYPQNFSEEIRELQLSGEAYFEVAKDPERPFVIKGPEVQVKVIGTTFNYNTRETWLALAEGKVELSAGKNRTILNPGEMASYARDRGFATRTFDYWQVFGWKEGIINIEGYNLKEVVNTLEGWYGVKIACENLNMDQEFSGQLDNKNLENILEGLCFSLDCEFKINDKYVQLFKEK